MVSRNSRKYFAGRISKLESEEKEIRKEISSRARNYKCEREWEKVVVSLDGTENN
jgi:hypothetical protein